MKRVLVLCMLLSACGASSDTDEDGPDRGTLLPVDEIASGSLADGAPGSASEGRATEDSQGAYLELTVRLSTDDTPGLWVTIVDPTFEQGIVVSMETGREVDVAVIQGDQESMSAAAYQALGLAPVDIAPVRLLWR